MNLYSKHTMTSYDLTGWNEHGSIAYGISLQYKDKFCLFCSHDALTQFNYLQMALVV